MSKWFSTILLSIILLMLVVGVVSADAAVNIEDGDDDERSGSGGEGLEDGDDGDREGTGGGDIADLPGRSGETVPGTLIPGTGDKASDKNKAPPGKPPSEPYGPPDVPEFSTIGMLAAGAAAGLGYLCMRKKRK